MRGSSSCRSWILVYASNSAPFIPYSQYTSSVEHRSSVTNDKTKEIITESLTKAKFGLEDQNFKRVCIANSVVMQSVDWEKEKVGLEWKWHHVYPNLKKI
jgi:hypothetical protein